MAPGTDRPQLKNRVQRPLHLVERSWKLRIRKQNKNAYTLSEKEKRKIYARVQYDDLMFNRDSDVGTPREKEKASLH